jgi:hypothetical protein
MTRPYCRRPGGCIAPKTGLCPLCQGDKVEAGRHSMQARGARNGLASSMQRAREKAHPIPLASLNWTRDK